MTSNSSPMSFPEFEALYTYTTNGIVIVDSKGIILEGNDSAHRILECDDLRGFNIKRFMPEQSRKIHDGLRAGFDASGEKALDMNTREPVKCITNAGSNIFLDISIVKHQVEGEDRYYAVLDDETDFMGLKQELDVKNRKLQDLLNKLMGANYDVIGETDFSLSEGEQGKQVIKLSESFLQLIGATKEQFEQKEYTLTDWMSLIHPADKKEARLQLNSYLAEKIPRVYLNSYRIKPLNSDEYIPVQTRNIAAWDDNGKLLYLTGSITDLRETFNELEKEKFKQYASKKVLAKQYLSQKNLARGLIYILGATLLFVFIQSYTKSSSEWIELAKTLPPIVAAGVGIWQAIKTPTTAQVERKLSQHDSEVDE